MKEGTKYDNGKLRLAEMIIDFRVAMEELCKVWEFGANKYEKSNWKKLANPVDRYTNAMPRHLLAEETNLVDDESKLLHAAHIAFNALARLHFIVRKTKYWSEPKDTTKILSNGLYSVRNGAQLIEAVDCGIHLQNRDVTVVDDHANPPIESPNEIDIRPGTITPMEWSDGGKHG